MAFDRDTRRRMKDRAMTLLFLICILIAIIPLGSILYSVTVQGVSVIDTEFFTTSQPIPCSPNPITTCTQGGIENAFVGTLILLALSCLIAIPLGILVGIYLAEYGKGILVLIVRFFTDIMTGVPSIVFGMFIYAAFSLAFPGHAFNAIAGVLALTILVMPWVARMTEEALRLVPNSLREAALALGVPKYKVTTRVVLSAAREGVLTGAVLGMARVGGETAPLIMTTFGNTFLSTRLDQPMAAMPLLVWNFATSPYANWQALAWGAALILVLMMLGLSIAIRLLLRRRFHERRIAA